MDVLKRLLARRGDPLHDWIAAGRPMPTPRPVKQLIVRAFALAHAPSVFVETGTYRGETLSAIKDLVPEIHSIEIKQDLHDAAKTKFADDKNIHLHLGDSTTVLPQLLVKIDRSCLFWLDGHFSGGITGKGALETPIAAELETILAHPTAGHIILIDDARCFGTEKDYPTVDQVRQLVHAKRPELRMEVKEDIIRIF